MIVDELCSENSGVRGDEENLTSLEEVFFNLGKVSKKAPESVLLLVEDLGAQRVPNVRHLTE